MKLFSQLLFITVFFNSFVFAYDLSDSLRINGYLNLYTIHTDEQALSEREKHLDTSGGIQANYQLTNNLSATAQIYLKEDEDTTRNDAFEVEAKWLYGDYYLGDDLTFRAGLFQFPIFKSAETGIIGYTMTWSESPLSNFGANGYDDFLGVELLKKYFFKDYEFLIQLSYGASENDLPTNKNEETINGKTNSLMGITLKTIYDWYSLNIGYLQATSKVQDYIPYPGADASSEKVDFYMIALEGQVDYDDVSFKTGYIKAQLSEIFPDELKYYASLEYRYNDFTPYIYYSNETYLFENQNAHPNALVKAIKHIYSVGTRYDYDENIALKFSYQKKIREDNFINNETQTDTNIYKVALDVLF